MRILILVLLFLTACSSDRDAETPKQDKEVQPAPKKKGKLSFETFNKIPSEIDGCSCFFSSDSLNYKDEKYIFADNFEDLAFVKIYGEMVRLKRISTEEFDDFSVKTNYSNEEYELTITVFEGEESGDESWFNHGKIILKTKSDDLIETEFFGQCGC